MTVEIKPIGDRCNISCSYCYEREIRKHSVPELNIGAMKDTITKLNQQFTIFGGEPLLTPIELLEDFFKLGLEKFKKNSIQTNALAITPEHIELFKKYSVHVGISLDGCGELNKARCNEQLTAKIENNINKLFDSGIIPSFIVTLSGYNTGPYLKSLLDWFMYLDGKGVNSIRLHSVEDNGQCADLMLTHQEQFAAYKAIYEFTPNLKNIRFDVFTDVQNALQSKTNCLTCIWAGCDPYNTASVAGIKTNGEIENCGRTYKDGILWLKSEKRDKNRQMVLQNTPQEDGGCKDCEYFFACQGHCPGTAIDGDWRNRSRDCEFLKLLFGYFEKKVGKVVSTPTICEPGHGDVAHGDVPHGDAHGDHTDASRIIVPVIHERLP